MNYRFSFIQDLRNWHSDRFSVQLDPRQTVKPIAPSQKAVGVDVGIKYFLADSQRNLAAH